MKSLLCAVVVCLFSVACDQGPTSPTAPTTPVMDPPVVTPPSEPSDFVGRVATPINTDRYNNRPVQGVMVSVVAGPRSGLRVPTDRDGQYVIPDFDGDELHIRLEKSGYETKEVIVHRMRPTEVLGQGPLGYLGPQQAPGTVLVGLEWPPEIKDIMRQMPIVPDLLLVLYGPSFPDGINLFGSGVVGVSDLNNMRVLAHEVCHAHQQWLIAPRGKNGTFVESIIENTPEGQAYELARQADWDEVGKSTFDLDRGTSSRLEGAAETCARWWDVDERPEYTRAWLQANAPNRARWARDWLTKR